MWGAVFAYVALVIDPHLIYDALGIYLPFPKFSVDRASFLQEWSLPAGPVRHVAAFFSQEFCFRYVGAVIITAVAIAIGRACGGLLRRADTRWRFLPQALAAFAVALLYRTYHHPLTELLSLTICLWCAVAWRWTAPRAGRGVRVALCLLASVGLYQLAGSVVILFGLLVAVTCVRDRRQSLPAGLAALAAGIVPWLIGAVLNHMTVAEAYSLAWPFGEGSDANMEPLPTLVLRGLFVLPLICALMDAVLPLVARALRSAGLDAFPEGQTDTRPTNRRAVATETAIAVALMAAALGGAHYVGRSPHRAIRFEMVHFSRHGQWESVLAAGRRLQGGRYDPFCNHLINRALYASGRLGDEMFSYAQQRAGLLLLTSDVPDVPPKYWLLSDTALELGDINLAEQWACETFETVGDLPLTLERLALICAVKRRYEAGLVFLRKMGQDVVFGRRAASLLEFAAHRDTRDNEWTQRVKRYREIRWSGDFVFQVYTEEFMLRNLLRTNPRNRMAFEYLMAWYLLDRRPEKIVENLPRLDDVGIKQIPRHYEEAILLYASLTGQSESLGPWKIRPETVALFQDFMRRFGPPRNHQLLDVNELVRDFPGSYLPYYAFGVSEGRVWP